jgi:serine/threonine protein kinase
MYSRASDYWALGIVLIEILTGQNPLQWFGSSKIASYQIVQGKVPIPDTLPAHWQRLLKGLLERDHYKRWDDERVLRWLVENRNSLGSKQGNWLRRIILLGSTILLIGFASVVSVEIRKSIQGTYDSPTLSLNSTKPIQPPSVYAERRLADQSLDLRTNPWLRIGLLTVAWVIAAGLVLAGFGHCISGTPHGFGFICGGIALAVAALYLPQLLR